MTYEPAEFAAFRQRLLASPGERQDVDYKASAPFANNDSFTLKLIRHILGMANNGGGWLVVGLKQKPNKVILPDPSHTDAIAGSYDPTNVTNLVQSFIMRGSDQLRLSIFLEIHPDTGLRYPEVQVQEFRRTPFVCRSSKAASDTGENILKQGVVYVRRPGAETSEISTLNDWEDLIARCVRTRRDEFLNEFRDLFERMTSSSPSARPSNEELLSEWASAMRNRAFGRQ